MLVAFLFGVPRLPAASLQLTRVLTTSTPTWVVFLQGLIGLVQFAIGLAMLTGYRRSGVGEASERSRLGHTWGMVHRTTGG